MNKRFLYLASRRLAGATPINVSTIRHQKRRARAELRPFRPVGCISRLGTYARRAYRFCQPHALRADAYGTG